MVLQNNRFELQSIDSVYDLSFECTSYLFMPLWNTKHAFSYNHFMVILEHTPKRRAFRLGEKKHVYTHREEHYGRKKYGNDSSLICPITETVMPRQRYYSYFHRCVGLWVILLASKITVGKRDTQMYNLKVTITNEI